MALWQFEPVAEATDPRWLDHPRFERVVVRAETSAQAREVAACVIESADRKASVGNETSAGSSALRDEKLYTVKAIAPEMLSDSDPDGPAAVLVSAR